LKSSAEYVVPDHQRMGVSKKRKHMFLLEEFIHQTKMGFNKEIFTLTIISAFLYFRFSISLLNPIFV
jgi:hypothetical protein